MKLILEGERKEQFCDCVEIWNIRHDLSKGEYVGVEVVRDCEVHRRLLVGYKWQPNSGCDCVYTRKSPGIVLIEKSLCKMHRPRPPVVKLPIERSVMK
jgi:hypothetical protein